RSFHTFERLLHDAVAVFFDRQERDLEIKFRLEMAGFGLLHRDHLLPLELFIARRVECGEHIALLDRCSFGTACQQSGRPATGRAGDVLELATDRRAFGALEATGSIQYRDEISSDDLAQAITFAKRPPIQPRKVALRVTAN